MTGDAPPFPLIDAGAVPWLSVEQMREVDRIMLEELGISPKPGANTFRIRDLSPIHNFHLLGPGVNKLTAVQKTGSATWTVRLQPGVYHYRCDPHRTIMRGSFTVS